jgi:hypothetical protein
MAAAIARETSGACIFRKRIPERRVEIALSDPALH